MCVKAVDICPGIDVNIRALLSVICPVDQSSPAGAGFLPFGEVAPVHSS